MMSLDDFLEEEKEELDERGKFVKMLEETHLSKDVTKKIVAYLDGTDFFTAPASTIYHNNIPNGLVLHSMHVAEILKKLTADNSIKWENESSPIVIGLLHDICKVNVYDVQMRNVKGEDGKWTQKPYYVFNDKNPLLGVHGDRSVAMILKLTNELTDQELACIRWHMGAGQEGDLRGYNAAALIEPNIVWAHMADNMASLTEPVEK